MGMDNDFLLFLNSWQSVLSHVYSLTQTNPPPQSSETSKILISIYGMLEKTFAFNTNAITQPFSLNRDIDYPVRALLDPDVSKELRNL